MCSLIFFFFFKAGRRLEISNLPSLLQMRSWLRHLKLQLCHSHSKFLYSLSETLRREELWVIQNLGQAPTWRVAWWDYVWKVPWGRCARRQGRWHAKGGKVAKLHLPSDIFTTSGHLILEGITFAFPTDLYYMLQVSDFFFLFHSFIEFWGFILWLSST